MRLVRTLLATLACGSLAFLLGCERPLTSAVRPDATKVAALRKKLSESAKPADSGNAPAAAEPNGWATIKGSFKIKGTAPAAKPLAVTKDVEVCAPGGKQVLSDDLVVDASGGIKNVLIFLTTKYPAGDAKWEHDSYAATKDTEVLFDQKDCIFLTRVFAFRNTQKVKVMNSDGVGHNTNITAKGKMAGSNQVIAGHDFSMYSAGGESDDPVEVACSIHPWMAARMISRPNPYFAVSKPDGTFEIANVPSGVDLEFRIWHEKTLFVKDAEVNGQAETFKKSKMVRKLENGNDLQLDVVLAAEKFGG